MTVARQRGKRHGRRLAASLAVFAVLFGAASAQQWTEAIDPNTGLALSGFDPVAYFTEHMPRFGRSDLELTEDGAVWRFENPGNRAAFVAHAEIYRPGFGGYDPVALARGTSVPGHPLIWAIVGERLYLFYSDAARREFLSDPGRVLALAERKWTKLAQAALP